MSYGLPYKGSKAKYASKLFSAFPKAENFYDLFAGGCAITHYAMTTDKFKNIIFNDINGGITQLFLDAINGKYSEENKWISREEFEQRKGNDPYIANCWSFGNNGFDYLYSKDIEIWKKALHFARLHCDCSLLKDFGIESDGSTFDIKKNMTEYKKKYTDWLIEKNIIHNVDRLKKCQSFPALESNERMNRIKSLGTNENKKRTNIQRLNLSYDKVEIKPNSVIYCDIPYVGINGDLHRTNYNDGESGITDFNFEAFFEWASNQSVPTFISSYDLPRDKFRCVMEIDATTSMGHSGTRTIERLFVPIHQKEIKVAKQLSLF